MSDDDPIAAIKDVPDRVDRDGTNHGISLNDARKAIKERGEERRAQFSGEPDFKGERVQSLSGETVQATEPIAESWRERMGTKYPHLNGMSVERAYQEDANFRQEYDAADEQMRILQEGYRRAIAKREDAGFRKLRPQAFAKDGVVEQFTKDAIAYLVEAKGFSKEQAVEAYNNGGLGKASEQAKLFDQSNAWARDKRELKLLDMKRNLNESMTLRDAVRRQTLLKKLGKA